MILGDVRRYLGGGGTWPERPVMHPRVSSATWALLPALLSTTFCTWQGIPPDQAQGRERVGPAEACASHTCCVRAWAQRLRGGLSNSARVGADGTWTVTGRPLHPSLLPCGWRDLSYGHQDGHGTGLGATREGPFLPAVSTSSQSSLFLLSDDGWGAWTQATSGRCPHACVSPGSTPAPV